MINSVINVDWLQLNCRSKHYDYFSNDEYKLEQTTIRTRNFLIVDEFYWNNRKTATIARKPSSTALDANIILIKFDNWLLYQKNLKEIIKQFLNILKLIPVNITRFDIALDFQRFNKNMLPGQLIKRFMSNKYLKIGKGKGSLHFNHNYHFISEYIRFGSNQSNICYYLYNKTKELNDVKKKPYIEDCWALNNFDKNSDTWRIEFSIKTGNVDIFNQETGELEPLKTGHKKNKQLNLDLLLDTSFIKDLFFTLAKKYFTFYRNTGGKKCRMPVIDLFGTFTIEKNLQYITKKIENGRADKIFLNKINSLNDELRFIAKDAELVEAQQKLIKHFVGSRNLHRYAKKKGIEF